MPQPPKTARDNARWAPYGLGAEGGYRGCPRATMIYPDLCRLKIDCPTGMVQAAAQAATPNVATVWHSLTADQKGAVIQLLKLEKQRLANNMGVPSTAAKTLVIKGVRNYTSMLPAYLQGGLWKSQPWQAVLSGPLYADLFTAPDDPGHKGYQIGEQHPNQPKDYADRLVHHPYNDWENSAYINSRHTGAMPASLSERDAEVREAWEALNGGATPASRDAEARRNEEALERLNNMTPLGVPPAPPPPDQEPELNVWNGLNVNQQNTVLKILAQYKELREYRGGYFGHEPQVYARVMNMVEALLAKLPPALNTPTKFRSVDWELALRGQNQYSRYFGVGGYRGHDDDDSD